MIRPKEYKVQPTTVMKLLCDFASYVPKGTSFILENLYAVGLYRCEIFLSTCLHVGLQLTIFTALFQCLHLSQPSHH